VDLSTAMFQLFLMEYSGWSAFHPMFTGLRANRDCK
jgi:hypothetical protein